MLNFIGLVICLYGGEAIQTLCNMSKSTDFTEFVYLSQACNQHQDIHESLARSVTCSFQATWYSSHISENVF